MDKRTLNIWICDARQYPNITRLNNVGGFIIPIKEDRQFGGEILGLGNQPGWNLFAIDLQVFNLIIGSKGIKIGADTWVAEADVTLLVG